MASGGKQLASEEIRGKTVAIIGGGPSGCGAAIRLVPLSRKQDLGLPPPPGREGDPARRSPPGRRHLRSAPGRLRPVLPGQRRKGGSGGFPKPRDGDRLSQ